MPYGRQHLVRISALFLALTSGAAADAIQAARDFADDFAIPRFQAVAVAAHIQRDAWLGFCSDRLHRDARLLVSAFGGVADAWAGVEFVRIGPASRDLRIERFNWWLDRTDATGKALSAMLEAQRPTGLAPRTLASGSVAGQGLPVLERLLFEGAAIGRLNGPGGARRCAVGAAVARNLSDIADSIVSDWTGPDGARAALAADTNWNVAFADAGEAANTMLTDLVAGLEILKDQKLAMMLHDIAAANGPKLAEGFRSLRSTRDIALDLAAIHAGLGVFLANAPPASAYQLDQAFEEARNALKALERVGPNRRKRIAAVQAAIAAFAALSRTAIAVSPLATGLALGFNGLDGD